MMMLKSFLLLLTLRAACAFTQSIFGSTYITAVNFYCNVQPGYVLKCQSAQPTSVSDTTNPTDCLLATDGMPQCYANAYGTVYYTISCAANYTPVGGANNASQVSAAATGSGPSFSTTAETTAVVGIQTNYDFNSQTSFTCVPNACTYTCTGNCVNSSGSVAPGTTATQLCSAQNYGQVAAGVPSVCPASGLFSWPVVCTNSASVITAANWFALAHLQNGYTIPNSCNCAGTNPTCPTLDANSPTCSQCYLPCTGNHRANTLAAAAFCPPVATTIAAINDCFEQAACNGVVSQGDTCVYGPLGSGSAPCPRCRGGSKKGLLGLLGLLGIIPAVLLSVSCCFLLCLLRRRKQGAAVNFATFDNTAPALVGTGGGVAPGFVGVNGFVSGGAPTGTLYQ